MEAEQKYAGSGLQRLCCETVGEGLLYPRLDTLGVVSGQFVIPEAVGQQIERVSVADGRRYDSLEVFLAGRDIVLAMSQWD